MFSRFIFGSCVFELCAYLSFAQSPLGPHLTEEQVCRLWSDTMGVSPPSTSYSDLARALDCPLSDFEFYPVIGYFSFETDQAIYGSYSVGTYLFKPNIIRITNLVFDLPLEYSFLRYDSYLLQDLGYFDSLSYYVAGVESSHDGSPWLALDPLLQDSTTYSIVTLDGAMVYLDFSSYYNLAGTSSNILFTNSLFDPVALSSANISHTWDFYPGSYDNECFQVAYGPFWYHHSGPGSSELVDGYVTKQDLINAGVFVDSGSIAAFFASPPASNHTVNSSTVNVSFEFSDSANLRAAFGWSDP